MRTEFYVSFEIKTATRGPNKNKPVMFAKRVHASQPGLHYHQVALRFCVEVPDDYLARSLPTVALAIKENQLIAPKIEACVMDALLEK